MKSILITLPAYNESKRLPACLDKLLPALDKITGVTVRVQVVDDGSRPAEQSTTRQDIDRRRQHSPLLLPLVELPGNSGKGAAILHGWRQEPGADYYAFLDADGAIPAAEVVRLISHATAKHPPVSVFASRIRCLGRTIHRRPTRHYLGRLFATVVGICILPAVYDSQCGFKILPSAHWQQVDSKLTGHRFAFDVELLAALIAKGLPVEEMAVDWTDIPGGKVSLLRDSFQMLASVISIHRKIRQGYYRETEISSQ